MDDLDSIPGELGECRDGLKLVEQALEIWNLVLDSGSGQIRTRSTS